MEQFVKMLYDRLETKKDLQMQLYVIMQNAINEMHNNGIIAGLTGKVAQLMHDPDPEVRVREKTSLAKSVGKQFIPNTLPVPSQGGLSYLANVNYDPRFVNSITLCFQGGIEGLHMTFANNPKTKLDKYIIQIISGGEDLEAFKANLEQLDMMYDDISIVMLSDGKVVYGEKPEIIKNEHENSAPVNATQNNSATKKAATQTPKKKLGFFAKIFKKD